ncbi:MAG: S26 family signal peptidase [Hydrogenimonas sp.]|nr:S26 family signal peptidase [Hydrogenimonas sp.]
MDDRIFEKMKNFYLQIEGNSSAACDYAKRYKIETFFDEDGCWKTPYSNFYKITHTKEVEGPAELIEYPKTALSPHSYFFMGDFRDNSTQSRFFGSAEYDRIYYKVWFTIREQRS